MTSIILNKEKKIEYELHEKIGEGQYGEVYRGRNCMTKEIVAIKKMKFMKAVDKALAEKEVQLMKVLKHKNILRYIDDFRMNGVWYIVLEYCAKGDLQKYKQKIGKLPEFHCKAFIRGILQALVELHSERVELGRKKIAHRDLKPANILISNNNELKLADFGFSKDFSDGWMKSFIGSPVTMAPEILNRKNYTQKCDVWSLGVIAFYMLYNQWPYYPTKNDGAGLTGLLNAVMNRKHKFDSKVAVSNEGKDFINCCLEKSMDRRKSSKQLLSHRWWDGEQNLSWTMIRSEAIESSFEQKPTKIAQKKLKFLLSEVINSHINKLINTQYNLSKEKIVQSLAIFKEYILSAEKLTLFIELLKEKLDEIKRRQFTIQYHKQEYKFTLGEINKVSRLISQCLQIIGKEIKEGSIVNTDIGPKGELALFLVDETEFLMDCAVSSETDKKRQLFREIANLLTLDIHSTSIELYWGQLSALSDVGTQIDNITINSNSQQILSMINEQVTPDDDVETIWTIVHNIDKNTQEKCTLDYELGKIVLSILEIPSNFNLDNSMTTEKIVLNSKDFFGS